MHELQRSDGPACAQPPEKHRAALRRPGEEKTNDGRAGVVADRLSKGAKF